MRKIYLLLCVLTLASCGGSGSSSVAEDAPVPTGDAPPDANTYPDLSWEIYAPADVNMHLKVPEIHRAWSLFVMA
jgi:hypothetical protein